MRWDKFFEGNGYTLHTHSGERELREPVWEGELGSFSPMTGEGDNWWWWGRDGVATLVSGDEVRSRVTGDDVHNRIWPELCSGARGVVRTWYLVVRSWLKSIWKWADSP